MKLLEYIARRSVESLVRVACVLALLALAMICYSVLSPRPLPVILAMSVGHGVGGMALICYVLAVALDAAGRRSGTDSPRANSSD
jgi:hypothetical protein